MEETTQHIIVYRSPFERDIYQFWTEHPEYVMYFSGTIFLVVVISILWMLVQHFSMSRKISKFSKKFNKRW